MPTPAQAEALVELLDTHTPLVVIETHEEQRLLALADKGVDGHPDAAGTRERPDARAAIDRLDGATPVLLLDIHPYLNHPLPAELPRTWPLSLTRAKAIAARRDGAVERAVPAD